MTFIGDAKFLVLVNVIGRMLLMGFMRFVWAYGVYRVYKVYKVCRFYGVL